MITIPLTQNQQTIIDDWNSDLAMFKWCALKLESGFYAKRGIPNPDWKHQSTQLLAIVILERKIGRTLEKHERCDHIDGNTLDNRESNLRVATVAQNAQNQKRRSDNISGYKGVEKRGRKWRAYIRPNGKQIHLGYFTTPELAYEAYCKAAIEIYGEFARLK